MFTSPAREQGEADSIFLQFWKTGYLYVTKTKEKLHVTHLMCSLLLLLTISLQLVPSYSKCLPSLLVFFSLLQLQLLVSLFLCCNLTETIPENIKFGGPEKDFFFFKFQNMFIWAKNFREHWNQACLSV